MICEGGGVPTYSVDVSVVGESHQVVDTRTNLHHMQTLHDADSLKARVSRGGQADTTVSVLKPQYMYMTDSSTWLLKYTFPSSSASR